MHSPICKEQTIGVLAKWIIQGLFIQEQIRETCSEDTNRYLAAALRVLDERFLEQYGQPYCEVFVALMEAIAKGGPDIEVVWRQIPEAKAS